MCGVNYVCRRHCKCMCEIIYTQKQFKQGGVNRVGVLRAHTRSINKQTGINMQFCSE